MSNRVLIPVPRRNGLTKEIANLLEPIEAIEFERSADGFLRCAECKSNQGVAEDTDPYLILDWHLPEHRARQRARQENEQIATILRDSYDRIAAIKAENR